MVFFRSLKYKLFFTICIISLIFMGLFALSYLVFYDDYVLAQNKKMLQSAYALVEESYDGSLRSIYSILEGFDHRYGIRAMLISRDFTIEFSSAPSQATRIQPSWSSAPLNMSGLILDSLNWDSPRFSQVMDGSSGIEFLLLNGKLQEGYLLSLRASLPAIQANAGYAGFFMLWSGLFAILFCILLAYGFSVRIFRPIMEINGIAKTMTKLDFSRKYRGEAKDEVGQLGQSINSLSSQLETTIGQLKESNAQLELEIAKERKIDEMRKNFIVNVSHELKTPLALVRGYAEGLKVNISSSEEDKNFYCDVILEESARMSQMVQQLLGLSQIEVGRVQPEQESVDLQAMAEKVCLKNKLLMENKGIRLENQLYPICVEADVDMLEQVLVNFLTNAVNHCPQGGEIILRQEQAGDKARLFVFNEGEPIPEEELENVWLNFYKVDKARTRAYGGSGIGLSLVKAIMEAHGNVYGVHNLEKGVEFWCDWDLSPGLGQTDSELEEGAMQPGAAPTPSEEDSPAE